jgi:diguanylate cyclase (GGDEF)-like protein
MRHSSSEHARTYLGIPLFQGGQVTGVLSVQAYEPNAYSPEQIQFIETIASHASIAIENARLYEEARRRADEMTKLYEISTALSSDLELNAVLERIFEICRQILPMDSFYVAIYDASSGHILHPLFWDDGKFKPIAVRDIHQSPGLTGEVILSRQTLYLPDSLVEKVREKYQIIHSGGKPARTYVGVPMMAHGSVIGVLSMQSYQPDAYQTEQIQLLETIATQAAIAIENSRLYEQARSELIQRKEAQEALEQTNSELQNQLSKVEALQLELREQAIRDSLTGLFNRRYLDESLAKRIERASDHDQPLSVIMLDIDRFKNFNDQHGHQAGDTLLRVLGKTLRDHTRATDFACRYGGEEFLIVLPNAPIEIAARRAEEIRMAFENTKIPFSGRSLHSTISLGVASYPLHGLTGEELIVRADQAMYAAKAAGRNLVKVWQGAQPQA